MRSKLTISKNCQSVIYRNGAADFLLSPEQVAGIGMAGYAALIVTGTALAVEPSRAATLLAISQARAADVPVIFDVDYRPYSWVSAADAAANVGEEEELDVCRGRRRGGEAAGAGPGALPDREGAVEGVGVVLSIRFFDLGFREVSERGKRKRRVKS